MFTFNSDLNVLIRSNCFLQIFSSVLHKTHSYIFVSCTSKYSTGCNKYICIVQYIITQFITIFIIRREFLPTQTFLPGLLNNYIATYQ